MNKHTVEEFADYCVYEILETGVHYLCVTKEYNIAKNIAKTFARLDPKCGIYYVTSVNYPGDFVPGGGWYDSWHKDKITGKLKQSSLS